MLFKLLLISSFLSASPTDNLKEQAREHLEKHEFEQALAATNEFLLVNPAEAHYLRAHIYLAQGQLNKAYQDAEVANQMVPGSIGQLALHKIEVERGNTSEALKHLEKSRQLHDFSNAEFLHKINLAEMKYLFHISNFDQAIQFWKKSKFGDLSYAADLMAARSFWKQKNQPQASLVLEEVLKNDRDAQYLLFAARFAPNKSYKIELLSEAEAKVRVELSEGLVGHNAELADILIEQGGDEALKEATVILEREKKIRNTAFIRGLLVKALDKSSKISFAEGQYLSAMGQKLKQFRVRVF